VDGVQGAIYRFAPPRREDAFPKGKPGRDLSHNGVEDLPYAVELWDNTKTTIELILAVTSSASIGYAAFYAALREFPDRYITLRNKEIVLSRANAPTE
jgi:hypothetical protein